MNTQERLLTVTAASKKFCKDMHWSMVHGISDVIKVALGMKLDRNRLRKQEFWAVKEANLTLNRGDFIGILGNNGSGKTTLMRMIAGIYAIDQGEIKVNGSLSSLFAIKTGMQPHFTGRENIYVKAGMFGMSKEMVEAKMDWIIDFAELEQFIDSPFGGYSAGMQARLGYSIAVASAPDILIIDEGLAVGDVSFKAKCYANLEEISPNCGIIFISHNIKRAEILANKLMVLDQGKVVCDTQNVDEGIEYYLENFAKIQTRKYLI
jgi:lipopolysaccharide transport system ATP-binding protein